MTAVAVSYSIAGPDDAPVVVLSNSLGATRAMWDPQVPGLAERYRVISYDTRGHGESPAPAGPYRLDDLVDDVVALLDILGVPSASVAGVSLGGMTAMRLAAREPQRVDRLALLCTSAKPNPQGFLDRAVAVRSGGTMPLAPAIAARWLTRAYAAQHPDLVAELETMIVGADDEAYAACCEAVAAVDVRADLARITAPTLVVSGREDVALPPEHQQVIAEGIAGAELVSVEAAHLANLEQQSQVTGLLLGHFDAAGGAR